MPHETSCSNLPSAAPLQSLEWHRPQRDGYRARMWRRRWDTRVKKFIGRLWRPMGSSILPSIFRACAPMGHIR
jgi:hypothetical protein